MTQCKKQGNRVSQVHETESFSWLGSSQPWVPQIVDSHNLTPVYIELEAEGR